MYDFDIFFKTPEGTFNHCIVTAQYMGAAVDYVEAAKGGEVYQAVLREKHLELEETERLCFLRLD